MALMRIKPRADLEYSASGCQKTINMGRVAEYIYKKYGKKSRVVTLDGGGVDPISNLVDAGMVQAWVLLGRHNLSISTIDLACQGYWPVDPDDPKSPLKAPTAATWEEIGFYGYEGLTSFGDAIMRILKRDKASLSQDPSYTYSETAVEVDGQKKVVSYSGGNMTYYGFIQDQLYDFVMKTHVLPVERVLWSALEGKGEEEGSRAPVYGPSIVGRKSTGKATQWFGNSVHIEQLITEVEDKDHKGQLNIEQRPVMYTRTHAGKDKIPFPCKTRAPYQVGLEVPTTFEPPDMAALYRKLDELNEKALTEVKKIMIVVPSVSSVPVAVTTPSGANGVSAEANPSRLSAEAGTPEAPDHLEIASAAFIKETVASVSAPHTFIPPRIVVKKPV